MLVSRLFSQLRLFNHSFQVSAQYAISKNTNYNSLQGKIQNTRTFADFVGVYTENRNEFNGEVFGQSSRHINSLLSRPQRYNQSDAEELMNGLQALEVSSLNEKSIASILSLMRNLKAKGYHSSRFNTLKNQLTESYISLIKERVPVESDLSDYINVHFEFTSFKHNHEAKIIAEKILRILEKGAAEGKINIYDNQISFLFFSFSSKPELTHVERKIRAILIRKLGRELDSVKLQDLVRIVVNLNRTDLFDLEGIEFSILKQITDRIFASVTDLEERTIYDLLKCTNIGKMPGFYKIIEEIRRNIFAEISDKGETDLSHEAIFKVFGSLSDKHSLSESTEIEQRKFFAFLSNYAQFCKQDDSRSKLFGFKIFDLVKNSFFSNAQKEELVTIIKKYSITLNVNTIFEMAIKDYDVSSFGSILEEFPVENAKEDLLIKLGVIANHIRKGDSDAASHFQVIEARIADFVSTPEKFMVFFHKIKRGSSQYLSEFNGAFGHLIKQLPNPFETETNIEGYRAAYLNYIHESYENKDYNQFINKFDSSITTEQFVAILGNHLQHDPRYMDYKRVLILHLNKRIYDIIESKNKRSIETVFDFLTKYSRFVVSGSLDANSEHSIFRILHCVIGKLDVITENDLQYYLFTTLEKYLQKSHKNYSVQINYRSLVQHLVAYIQRISTNRHNLSNVIVKEALKLGLLTKKSIENVNVKSMSLPHFQRERAQHIKDPSYTPSIERVTNGTLEILFTNPNLESQLVENEKKVIELIASLGPRDLAFHLSIINISRSPSSKRILAELLNNFIAKFKSADRIDLIGLMQNAYEKNIFSFYQYKKVTERIIEEYRKKIHNFSVDNHLELIKFIVTQPNLNPTDYYNELVAYADKRDITETQFEQILLRLAHTNYKFKEVELDRVETIVKKYAQHGLYFFLMVEPSLEPAKRSAIVSSFVEKFNKMNEQKKENLNKLQYLYLKKQYPTETANLNIEEDNLYFEKFSPKPRDEQLLNTIFRLSGNQYEELKGLGNDNYLIKIQDYVFTFLYSKRLGSFYEHEFLKRAITALQGENLKNICIYIGSAPAFTLEYINKHCPGLLEQEQYQKIVSQARAQSTRKRAENAPQV